MIMIMDKFYMFLIQSVACVAACYGNTLFGKLHYNTKVSISLFKMN